MLLDALRGRRGHGRPRVNRLERCHARELPRPARGASRCRPCSTRTPSPPRRATRRPCSRPGCTIAAVDRGGFALVRPPGHHALPRPRDGLLPVRQRRRRRPLRAGRARARARRDRRLGRPPRQRHAGRSSGTTRLGALRLAAPVAVLSRAPAGPDDENETTRQRAAPGRLGRRGLPARLRRAWSRRPCARSSRSSLLVSAGFDAHVDDPLAEMRVTADGFRELARRSAALGAARRRGARRRLRPAHAAGARRRGARRVPGMTTAGPEGRPFFAEEAQSHRAPAPSRSGADSEYRARGRSRVVGESHPPRWGIRAGLAARAVASASSASRREETSSLRSRLFTCERTVCSEMKSRCAISSVPRCSSSRSSTSSSRALSEAAIESGTPRPTPPSRTCSSSRRATSPESAASPSRDAAQELGDPLGRLALQQVAGRAAADRGEQVLLGARGGQDDDLASRARPRAAAAAPSSPSMPGIERSSRTRSGCSRARELDRLLAVGGLADDVEAVLARAAPTSASRVSGWSSTSRIRMQRLIGSAASADKSFMRHDERDDYQAWLWEHRAPDRAARRCPRAVRRLPEPAQHLRAAPGCGSCSTRR